MILSSIFVTEWDVEWSIQFNSILLVDLYGRNASYLNTPYFEECYLKYGVFHLRMDQLELIPEMLVCNLVMELHFRIFDQRAKTARAAI